MPTAPTVTRDPAVEAHVFWFKYRREILMAIGVVVLALLGYATYWFYTERRDNAAAAALASARDSIWASQAMQELRLLKPAEPATGPGLPGDPALRGAQPQGAAPPMLARPPEAPAPAGPAPSAASPGAKPTGSKP